MALQITGQAQGLVLSASQKSGAPSAVSTGWHNEFLKSDLLPRYAYLGLSGFVYSAATTTGVALAAAGTNSPILTVWNPTGSGKNLVLIDAAIALTTQTFAAVAVGVELGGLANTTAPSTVTAVGPNNNFIGSGTVAVAKSYSQATLAATPFAIRHIATFALDLNTSVSALNSPAMLKDEMAGAVIVAPGSLVNIFGVGTPADVTVVASMTWAELPI